MKKFLIAILLFLNFNSKAQITLEYTLDSTAFQMFYCTDIGNNDFKYVFLNAASNSFSLFNMDMSPYLTNINIPASDSISQGFGVIYITKELFDCDSTNIEYAYNNPYNVDHPFRIFRTDGTLLLQVDSANGPFAFGGLLGGSIDIRPIINTSAGTKLFIQKYDSNNVAEVLIYALCGSLPDAIYDFSESNSYVKVYPNPTSMELHFEITTPNNQEAFSLLIFDSSARGQALENINLTNHRYSLNVRNYSSGTYMYSLVSKNKVFQSGKFTIVK